MIQKKSSFYIAILLQIILCVCLTSSLQAQTVSDSAGQQQLQKQETRKKFLLEGYVRDQLTGEGIAFATLRFSGKTTGFKADINGLFRFTTNELPGDTLYISSVGYRRDSILLSKNDAYRYFKIELERSSIQMRDFVIHESRDPALALIRKVIRNKELNNYDKAENYRYEVYNKLEMDINKIPKKAFKVSPLLKKFSFVQQYMDSTSDEKPFLPLFLTESISDYYYQKKPKKMKEVIKGSRISGYKNQSVSQLLGAMYQNLNVYSNNMLVFEVPFTSPVADNAPFFYSYQLNDTQIVHGKRYYQVILKPKRKGEHCFEGDIWIHDSDFAIQKVNLNLGREQNINWVNRVSLVQEFTCLHDSLWFLSRDKFYVDFLPPHGDKVAGFLGRKTTTYRNIHVNEKTTEDFLNDKKEKAETIVMDQALNRNEEYWNEVRHDSLSKNEKTIYKMIDTIQHLPVYERYYSFFYLLATGIVKAGPIEIGPIYNLYSKNVIEGSRWRFTLGTTPKLAKNLYIQAYAAYGMRDQRFKYFGSALWILKRNPRMYLYGEYKHDVDNSVNQSDGAGTIDNIFGTIGRKNVPWKLAYTDKQLVETYKSFHNGLSFRVYMERKQFQPLNPLPVPLTANKQNGISSFESGIELRYAHREQFVEGNYWRTSLGTRYPVIKLMFSQGIKDMLDGQYHYSKLRMTGTYTLRIPHAGSIMTYAFGGKVWGTLPYSLLEVHPGNEFYYYSRFAFNMMYRYEYLSDTYAGLMAEHALGTLFFKYIPYVKKMKIRTFWNVKGVYGNLSNNNRILNSYPDYSFQTLHRSPYLEAGTGIENILKVLRIDCVWRVLPYRAGLNDSPIRRFGVFGSLKFDF